MQKYGRIVLGVLVFVLMVASPILYNLGKKNTPPDINLDTPVIAQLSDKECVEPKEYMRENHMKLLLEWRDSAVRDGKTVYINSQGQAYEISLQGTCLNCHNNIPISEVDAVNDKKGTTAATNTEGNQFCFSCHTYSSVEPNCWNCHSDPREAIK